MLFPPHKHAIKIKRDDFGIHFKIENQRQYFMEDSLLHRIHVTGIFSIHQHHLRGANMTLRGGSWAPLTIHLEPLRCSRGIDILHILYICNNTQVLQVVTSWTRPMNFCDLSGLKTWPKHLGERLEEAGYGCFKMVFMHLSKYSSPKDPYGYGIHSISCCSVLPCRLYFIYVCVVEVLVNFFFW